MRRFLTTALATTLIASSVSAETFRWASGTDPQTMDPHAVNSAPVLGFLNNVYEGLVRRGQDMSVEGALAERWEPLGGEGWRFHLRKGVTFHDGATFDAEDVLFSYQRASSEAADTASWFSPVSEVKVVDSHTIDFMTKAPNPLFPSSIANFMILDKGWAEANDVVVPAKDAETFATLNTNGTGAFQLVERQPGLKTVLEPFAGWWGEVEHNITRAEYVPIKNDATRIAALLSNEVDMINPVPIQDAKRLADNADTQVIQGIEARVIMLAFGHEADTLKYSADAGKQNPFQDQRVRQAVAHAINVDAILATIMRGNAEAASQLVSPAMSGYSAANSARPAYDVDKAKALLADAGYADGFSFGLKCPNDRYLNDEAVCQAAVSMLAQVGITAELEAMPVAGYWNELRADNYDMYLLGWSPGTLDAEHPIRFLVTTPNPDKKLGSWNYGGFSNARVDELLPLIQSEIDPATRQAMIDEVTAIYTSEVAYVPLYVQPLVWGVRSGVEVTQRPDNFFILRWVNKG
ncbi:MAG: ABC transporter substrate-binding protein [Pseudomonadota bacterium]